MRGRIIGALAAAVIAISVCLGGCQSAEQTKVRLDPKNPTVVVVWHYYNGTQKKAFDDMVTQFNESVGQEQGIIVEGLDNCLVKFSKCCTPVPGDDIIGFITRGYGVSVHRCDCPNASEEKRSQPGQEGRWIKVSWGGDTNDSYPTILEVVCKDRQGLLLDISAALSTTNTFVLGINSRSTEDQFAIFRLEIRVKDGAQLKSVMNKLNQISGVLKVNRPAG